MLGVIEFRKRKLFKQRRLQSRTYTLQITIFIYEYAKTNSFIDACSDGD